MTPMLDIQRRHAEVFRLRFGDKGTKGQPQKLTDAIRVTSASQTVVAAFTEVYGGTVENWESGFEAYLPTTEIPIMVLPGQSITQWWERYRGSVCERRCDGITETINDQPCVCSSDVAERMSDKDACKPMTRVNILCPEVAVVGAGSIVTHGLVAAETLPQSVAVAEAALNRGLMVPGTLRVVEHKGKRHYVVPQIEIVGVSLGTLMTGETPQQIAPTGTAAPALGRGEAGPPTATPAPSQELPPLPDDAEPDAPLATVEQRAHLTQWLSVIKDDKPALWEEIRDGWATNVGMTLKPEKAQWFTQDHYAKAEAFIASVVEAAA